VTPKQYRISLVFDIIEEREAFELIAQTLTALTFMVGISEPVRGLLFCSEGITLTKFQAQIPFQLSIVFPAL
jgi:hypothetical protein